MSKTCPNCSGNRIGQGVLPTELLFKPGALRSFTFVMQNGVKPISRYFWACLDCGHFWGTINPMKLREFIIHHASGETRTKWGLTNNEEKNLSHSANYATRWQPLSDRVLKLASDPSKLIQAIKAYREETSASLAEAKAAIDTFLNTRYLE